jgi:hypothetical protein
MKRLKQDWLWYAERLAHRELCMLHGGTMNGIQDPIYNEDGTRRAK